ncbi:hypothetical protein HAX54_044665, partial [Datura stramonium]|nr:hypothetical protein [Datura stramonium]
MKAEVTVLPRRSVSRVSWAYDPRIPRENTHRLRHGLPGYLIQHLTNKIERAFLAFLVKSCNDLQVTILANTQEEYQEEEKSEFLEQEDEFQPFDHSVWFDVDAEK